jgi:hypothetical protein
MAGTILMYVLFGSRRKYLQDRVPLSVNVGGRSWAKRSTGDQVKYVYNDIDTARKYKRGDALLGRWIRSTGSFESGDIELYQPSTPSDL